MSTFLRESGKYKPYELQHRFRRRILFLIKFLVIVCAFYLFIQNFFLSSFLLLNQSMAPTFIERDRIFVTPFLYGPRIPFSKERIFTVRSPKRGDIVVYIPPESMSSTFLQKAIDPIVRFFTLNRVYSISEQLREHEPKYLIKRVIGIPGDTIELRENGVYIKSAESRYFLHEMEMIERLYKVNENRDLYTSTLIRNQYAVDEGEYFILGDNRLNSLDSFDFGAVDMDYIYGKVIFRYLPFKRFGRP